MYIETTANIDFCTYRTIKATAKALGVSARRLVHILLKIVVREIHLPVIKKNSGLFADTIFSG